MTPAAKINRTYRVPHVRGRARLDYGHLRLSVRFSPPYHPEPRVHWHLDRGWGEDAAMSEDEGGRSSAESSPWEEEEEVVGGGDGFQKGALRLSSSSRSPSPGEEEEEEEGERTEEIVSEFRCERSAHAYVIVYTLHVRVLVDWSAYIGVVLYMR